MEVTYGYKMTSIDDELFIMGEEFERFLVDGTQPSLLDISPICEFSHS